MGGNRLFPILFIVHTHQQVWVLDSLPGEVRAGDLDGTNHPAKLIDLLRSTPLPIPSRTYMVNRLTNEGE